MQYRNHEVESTLLSKIMLSRFLMLPLKTFDRLVSQTESSILFSQLRPWVSIERVEGAHLMHDAAGHSNQTATLLGAVHQTDDCLAFFFQRDSYIREYRFDEAGISRLMSRSDFSAECGNVLHQLRLINTRNRLSHAVMQALLRAQAGYLRSESALTLMPLTQASFARQLRLASTLSMVVDTGRLSRLIRGLSIALPSNRTISLGSLFPKPRQVHRNFVEHVIQREKAWISQGVLSEPRTDQSIAASLQQEYGLRLSRRTVAHIRHDLAIPDCRSRRQYMDYQAATDGFSTLMPLTAPFLRVAVPAHPGVYEIRTTSAFLHMQGKDGRGAENDERSEWHNVLYIGSSGDLRKRLGEHLSGNSDNPLLYRHIEDGVVRVRFRLVSEGWRLVERDLYRVFYDTFGAPPLCNRMSP